MTEEIRKHINDTNASYRHVDVGDAKNTDLFLDNEHYKFFEDSGEQITVRFHKTNLTQAVLFIAAVLPRKFDQSAIHEIISYSDSFVYDQLAILNELFKGSDTFTQTWNARKNVPQKNGKIDTRFYFNGLLQEVQFVDTTGVLRKTKFTIRNYFVGGFSDVIIRKADDGIFDIYVENTTTTAYDDGNEDGLERVSPIINETAGLQQIYYGAPGTGKSHSIKEQTRGKNVIRTTFHPDSDYSTFVGAYKPTTIEVPILSAGGQFITKNGTMTWDETNPNLKTEQKIVYEFVSQAFLQAYVNAWKFYSKAQQGVVAEEQYLVIEEINRGNCAQIFGDLFQLLDRNDSGFSDYPIKADNDMKRQLAKAFVGLEMPQRDAINALYDTEDIVGQVLSGEILLLPNNLYIWATMNTSDQSLFPVDSAFKRRWDWKYMPISNAGKGWRIVAHDAEYDWWQFLSNVNEYIGSITNSEDKKLGYFFCKAKDGKIDAETFVGKVVFYLWNDVFKGYGFDGALFKAANGSTLTFDQFYGAASTINETSVTSFLENLKVDKFEVTDEAEEEREGGDDENDTSVFSVEFADGTRYSAPKAVETFKQAIEHIGIKKVLDLQEQYDNLKINGINLISSTKHPKYHQRILSNGMYLSTQCDTPTKARILNRIANYLNINLIIQMPQKRTTDTSSAEFSESSVESDLANGNE